MKVSQLKPEFVEFIPEVLKDGTLYISGRYSTATHKCCCGCGEEVVTPLSPTDWALTMNGDQVTLHPSIGNWSFACRSHYLIRNNRVVWAGSMTKQQIEKGRKKDRAAKKAYFETVDRSKASTSSASSTANHQHKPPKPASESIWSILKRWWNS